MSTSFSEKVDIDEESHYTDNVTIQNHCAENNVSYVQARQSIVFAQRS